MNTYTQHDCVHCGEDLLIYNQGVSDWHCEGCGEWEEGETL